LFDPPWHKTIDGLNENLKSFALNEAGYYLRALGRLAEAAQPMQTALEISIQLKDWPNAARHSSNLSELYLTIGNVRQALAYAKQSVGLAEKSGDEFVRMVNRTKVADAQHQAGNLTKAQSAFIEAEDIQKKRQPEFPLLYSLQGFLYCDLLLSQVNYAEVEQRANWMVERSANDSRTPILTIALENLSLACSHVLHFQDDPNFPVTNLPTIFNRAVDGLRQAGTQHMLPLGLLARAGYYRVTGKLNRAQRDLDEAFTIATRGGMGLYLADCHLEYTRLYLAKGDKPKAREHWQIAKDSIEKMGYHRRDKEVQELEEQLK
jgi:tetratricopeptide (TPR) repeat protein